MFIDWLLILIIGLFIAGFILVGIEMVTPGLHAPGVLGMACLVVAVFLISDTFVEGAIITIIVLAVLAIMLALILGLLSRGKLKSPIILKEEQNKDKGYISSNDLSYLLGKEGIALTDLRPTGIGNFDGIDFDVLSEGKYISKGTKLVIFKVQGSKLIVKEMN
ncbi:MAG TPA: serine protease [Clostridiales bacterium]|nr:serine protease [Clostridiales bacterium]